MTLRAILAHLVFASCSVALPIHAAAQGALPDLIIEEQATGWQLGNFNVFDADQRDVPASEREIDYTGVMAWTANSEAPGLLLTCNEKKALSATFSLAPVDFSDPAVTSAKTRVKARQGRLIIDGDRPAKKQQFLLRRKINVVHAMNVETAYSVVNAIYAKKPVSLEIDGEDDVSFDLPPVDDTLKEFVANCPAFKQDGE